MSIKIERQWKAVGAGLTAYNDEWSRCWWIPESCGLDSMLQSPYNIHDIYMGTGELPVQEHANMTSAHVWVSSIHHHSIRLHGGAK